MKPDSERDLQYRALFDTMSEDFALCDAEWDEAGRLKDYTIVEINPALQSMLGVGRDAVGTKLSDSGWNGASWLELCEGVLRTGEPVGFEFHNRNTGRWHVIRLTRVAGDRIAQFFFDVTEQKLAIARQQTLFDELNHRVRNNLSMVAGLLSMQARTSEGAVRAQLMKAIDRVQTISELHGSLYQGGHKEDVEFGAYLERLCERLATSVVDEERIGVTVEAQPAVVPLDHAVPLGIIVNELVTNAAKYAYPAPSRGEIRVSFGPTARGLKLSVSDVGRGLATPQTGQKAEGAGLGMKLVRSMVQQIGGRLRVTGPPGAGFEVLLPNPVVAADE